MQNVRESVTVSARNIGRITWWFAVLCGLIFCGLALLRQKNLDVVYLDKLPLIVEVAATEKARVQGLSDRKPLPKGHGMLFEFDGAETRSCIWMKNMNFAIDAYWYDKNGQLLTAKTGLQPDSYPRIYCPDLPANYLLEVPAGQFKTAPKQLVRPVNQ